MMPSDHFVMFYNEMFKFLAETRGGAIMSGFSGARVGVRFIIR